MREVFPDIIIRASAGSGKTHALTMRVLELLIRGVEARHILATTFTRKAAGEIKERVFRTVLKLIREGTLVTAEGKIAVPKAEAEAVLLSLIAAQHLMQIVTMDGFCTGVARAFALELGLPPQWRVLEEGALEQLRSEVLTELYEEGAADQIAELMRALSRDRATRSVHERLLSAIGELDEAFLAAYHSAWRVPPAGATLSAATIAQSLSALRAFSPPKTKKGEPHKSWESSLRTLIREIEEGEWEQVFGKGVANKIAKGEETFYKYPIPQELIELITPLISHVQSAGRESLHRATTACFELAKSYRTLYERKLLAQGVLTFTDVKRAVAAADETITAQAIYCRLDSRYNHLLLDEFQDTSLAEWRVLLPLAEELLSQSNDERSFLCVGDPKQAIYGWRGGVSEIFNAISDRWPHVQCEPLAVSRRSAQTVIDLVNGVFLGLDNATCFAKYPEARAKWQEIYEKHSTVRSDLTGYASFEIFEESEKEEVKNEAGADHGNSGDDEDDDDETQYPPSFIRLQQIIKVHLAATSNESSTIGILVRDNKSVAALLDFFATSDLASVVSGEGGVPLLTSPAVRVVVAFLRVTEHPHDSIARFVLCASALGAAFGLNESSSDAECLRICEQWRSKILTRGFLPVLLDIEKLLTPHLTPVDVVAFSKLLQIASSYAAASIRFDPLIDQILHTRVEIPGAAKVRVMTVHKSKGLEFDTVIIPQLETPLIKTRKQNLLLMDREAPLAPYTTVMRRPTEGQCVVDKELAELVRRSEIVELDESLSVIYVALTRARKNLYLLANKVPKAGSWGALVREALGIEQAARGVVYERGEKPHTTDTYTTQVAEVGVSNAALSPGTRRSLSLTPATTPRILPQQSPSRDVEELTAQDLFVLGDERSKQRGTKLHLLCQQIEFLDGDTRAIRERLRAVCEDGELIEYFLAQLQKPSLRAPFLKETYLRNSDEQLELWRERPFVIKRGGGAQAMLVKGIFDRVILVRNKTGILMRAHLFDFKSGTPQGASHLSHYTKQLALYAEVLSELLRCENDRIDARLVWVDVN